MSDNSKNNAENEWMELVKTALWAVLLAMTIRTVLFEPFNIPSGSMKPNLLVGDYLFVSKYAYGYSRYSMPLGLIPLEGRILADEPDRADVVVFKLPSDNKTDYIKRVIGLPGDTVQVRNGQLYLNGERAERELIDQYEITKRDGSTRDVSEYWQTLPDGERFKIYEYSDGASLDNTRRFTVPEGHYFMMGDNRDDSLDSRADVGFVPFDNLVGEAEMIFFSTNGHAGLIEFWKWPWTVRYDRLFNMID